MGAFKGASKQGGGFNWGNAALAFFGGGDVLQALQRRQEIERARQLAAAQQEAAAGLGLTKAEIAGMDSQDVAALVRERAYRRMLDPLGGAAEEANGGAAAATAGVKASDAPDWTIPRFAPSPGRPPADPNMMLASGQYGGRPGFGGAGPFGSIAPGAPWLTPMPVRGNVPRAQTFAQAAGLPRGSHFFAPNGSLRAII